MDDSENASPGSPDGSARVVATYGREFDLRFDDGLERRARIRGRRLQPVCGDRVVVEPLPGEARWLIAAILPRRNELTRPDRQGRSETLAANVDFVAVVAAALPTADWFIVDRYLCAAELIGADSCIIFNKTDLGEADGPASAELAAYAAAGYRGLELSAHQEATLAPLREMLAQRTAVLVGQSGVGKSTLINALVGDELLPTAPVSEKRKEGRHTTVTTRMRQLPGGGEVIDSPGVRDYAPAVTTPGDVSRGYREIREAASHCRFADCTHLQEPDCGVTAGVAAGKISARRYESYRRMFRLSRKLRERSLRKR